MAKANTARSAHKHQAGNRVSIVCGALFIPTAVLIMIGMLPAIVAYLIDNDRKKSISITVALMNAAGVVPFVIELWKKGQTLHTSFDIVEKPMVWLFMYGSAAMGWLIVYSVPAVVQALLSYRAKGRIDDIDKRHQALVELWGESVRSKPKKD
jgi:hypothetical protein